MTLNYKISEWKNIVEFIENSTKDYPDITNDFLQYRGQSNKEWKLEPSLLRIVKGDKISENKARFYEKEAEMEFSSQVHIVDEKIIYPADCNPAMMYVDMQHFSCPTRLLDWTTSPYIALYFAVSDSYDKDAAFFCWDMRFYDKKMRSLYSDYSTMPSTHIISHTSYDVIQLVMSLRKNIRIVKQQGTFTISNNLLKSHCELINEIFPDSEPSGLYKLEIPKEIKLEFLARLKYMNISAAALFPGLDGLGRSIQETLLLRKWKQR